MSKKITITNEVSMLEFAGKLSDGSTEKTMSELLASGGTKKYAHFIKFGTDSIGMIICDISNEFSLTSLATWLYDNGYTSQDNNFRTIISVGKGSASTDSATFSINKHTGVYAKSRTTNLYLTNEQIAITYDSATNRFSVSTPIKDVYVFSVDDKVVALS